MIISSICKNKGIFSILCALLIIELVVSFGTNNSGCLEAMYGIARCTGYMPTVAQASSSPYVIAIDPGHGGTDTGAQAIVEEYQVIDKTASYLYDLLSADENFTPIYTRTDADPDSSERARIANSSNAQLFISIHANSDSHKSSKGFECFPTPPGRTFHQQSLEFAQLVVENMREAGHTIRGDEQKSGIKYAYYYGKEKKIVDSSDTKVRSRKSFGVLEKTNCPRVLVEQCFITNYSDVENWATDQGCERAAQLYYQAIKKFFEKT